MRLLENLFGEDGFLTNNTGTSRPLLIICAVLFLLLVFSFANI